MYFNKILKKNITFEHAYPPLRINVTYSSFKSDVLLLIRKNNVIIFN